MPCQLTTRRLHFAAAPLQKTPAPAVPTHENERWELSPCPTVAKVAWRNWCSDRGECQRSHTVDRDKQTTRLPAAAPDRRRRCTQTPIPRWMPFQTAFPSSPDSPARPPWTSSSKTAGQPSETVALSHPLATCPSSSAATR